MSKPNRGKAPYVRPLQRVEISESNVKLRLILIVLLLAIAATALVVGVSSALKTEPGWQPVTVQSLKVNCGDDFVLDYDFSADGSAASSQFKKLTTLYSTACEDAYRIFNAYASGEGAANVYDLNGRPNEPVTVDPVLYHALELLQRYQSRNLYLAPVYTEYDRIFRSESEVEAASYDPVQNQELVADFAKLAFFANDPSMIDMQLLGNNQVKLVVADAYLTFAKDYEIERLIDFSWMKNAFIADYLAQVLTDHGFTNGYLVSFDGFTRNLDTRGNTYAFNVFDRMGKDIYTPAVLTYTAPASIVSLRDYPLSKSDVWHYYAFQNGRIANLLVDPADGMCKASLDSLVSYSADQSCAELLLQMIPVFISDDFSAEQVRMLVPAGIHSIWCEDSTVYYTDAQANLAIQPQPDVSYSKVFGG